MPDKVLKSGGRRVYGRFGFKSAGKGRNGCLSLRERS